MPGVGLAPPDHSSQSQNTIQTAHTPNSTALPPPDPIVPALPAAPVLASVRFRGQRVKFIVPATDTEPRLAIVSNNTISADSSTLFQTLDANGSVIASEAHVAKATFLREEAKVGKTLVVKVKDAEKFRSRCTPEELCINMKEKRLEVAPNFFWNIFGEYSDDSWHCWVCVCSSKTAENEQLKSENSTNTSKTSSTIKKGKKGKESSKTKGQTKTSSSTSLNSSSTSNNNIKQDILREQQEKYRYYNYTPSSLELYEKPSNYLMIEDSPEFTLGDYDHVCGVIILQQFVHDSEYFQYGEPLTGKIGPSDPATGAFSDVAEVSVFCAKACGSKLLTALVEYVYQTKLPYRYLITASTNTAQSWYYQHGFQPFTAYRIDPKTIDRKKMSKKAKAQAAHLYRHRIPDSSLDVSHDEPAHMLFLDIEEQYMLLQHERIKGNTNAYVGCNCLYNVQMREKEKIKQMNKLRALQQQQQQQQGGNSDGDGDNDIDDSILEQLRLNQIEFDRLQRETHEQYKQQQQQQQLSGSAGGGTTSIPTSIPATGSYASVPSATTPLTTPAPRRKNARIAAQSTDTPSSTPVHRIGIPPTPAPGSILPTGYDDYTREHHEFYSYFTTPALYDTDDSNTSNIPPPLPPETPAIVTGKKSSRVSKTKTSSTNDVNATTISTYPPSSVSLAAYSNLINRNNNITAAPEASAGGGLPHPYSNHTLADQNTASSSVDTLAATSSTRSSRGRLQLSRRGGTATATSTNTAPSSSLSPGLPPLHDNNSSLLSAATVNAANDTIAGHNRLQQHRAQQMTALQQYQLLLAQQQLTQLYAQLQQTQDNIDMIRINKSTAGGGTNSNSSSSSSSSSSNSTSPHGTKTGGLRSEQNRYKQISQQIELVNQKIKQTQIQLGLPTTTTTGTETSSLSSSSSSSCVPSSTMTSSSSSSVVDPAAPAPPTKRPRMSFKKGKGTSSTSTSSTTGGTMYESSSSSNEYLPSKPPQPTSDASTSSSSSSSLQQEQARSSSKPGDCFLQ